MNCCSNSGSDVRRMVMQPGLCRPAGGPGPVVPGGSPAGQQGSQMPGSYSRFPVGMGSVPMQNWETPYPLATAFSRGTIFPSLDYPFMRARCRA